MPEEVDIPEGEGLLIRSPASFTLIAGRVEVWGAEVDGATIPLEGIELLITASSDSRVRVNGSYLRLRVPIPKWWKDLPDLLSGKRVLFLGRVDSGKSSTMLYTLNKLLRSGKVSLIDSDVGQSDLGPPGVISSKDIAEPVVHTKLLEPDFMHFVGDKTPSGHFLPMIRGVVRALDESRGDTVLINTTGFVDGGAARALKRSKMEFADPDVVILLEKEEGDLSHMAKIVPKGVKVFRYRSPAGNRTKSRDYRMIARRALIRRYLSGASTRRIHTGDVELVNTFLMTGVRKDEYVPFLEHVLETRIHWLEESPDMLVALAAWDVDRRKVAALSDLLNKEVRVGPVSAYRGLYVGLTRDGRCVGVGLMEAMNLREGWVDVLSGYEGMVDGLALGYIRFNAEGDEIGSRGMNIP